MSNIPTPIRAALGLAATAVDEARKLPETLPQAVNTVPLRAVSTVMQASLKLQQHLAALSARGDEVLSQLRGRSAEPPSWATFDSSPGAADPQADEPARAAFDRIDYDNTGYAEATPDDDRDRWDAVGVGGTEPDSGSGTPAAATTAPAGSDNGTAPPPSAAEPVPPAPTLADAVSPANPAKATPTKATPAKAKSAPAKAAPAKAAKKAGKPAPAKADGAKAGADSPTDKAGPAKAKPGARKAEPLEVAASKAPPAGTPTPSTMAAEILHAHEADAGTE